LTIQPPAELALTTGDPTKTIAGSFELRVTADRTQAATKYLLLGEPDGSRLEIGKLVIEIGGRFTGSGGTSAGAVSIGGSVGGGKLHVSLDDADGFLGNILGGIELDTDFEFAFGLSSDEGLFFEGSSAL